MTYPYILPPLPYAPAALEPNLGRSSVRLHHDAFFAAYVDRLNGALVPWTQYQDWPLERLLLHWCQLPRTLGQAVRRYGGGVYNHGLYFSSLAPARTTKPSGELLAEVVTDQGEWTRALLLLCSAFDPKGMGRFTESVEKYGPATKVIRITPRELTGKENTAAEAPHHHHD